MKRIAILSVAFGLGLVQAACGSSKTTATSTPTVDCVPASDDYIREQYPTQAVDPNILHLYTDLGAQADVTFANVTNSIVKNALAASPNDVGGSFQSKLAFATTERQTEFTNDLKNFLAAAFGGPAYPSTAPQMVEAHSDLNITVAQYNAFISGVVVPALKSNGVDDATIGKMAPVVNDPEFVKTVVSCH